MMTTAEKVKAPVSTVTVTEVTTKKELRRFVNYPNVLYRNNPYFVPAFYGDDMADWNRKKNPAFGYCEARCWLARRDGEIVGRIGAILSHRANEKWGTSRMRFSQVDFIDDPAVSDALFAAVEQWAAEKGCQQVHGPLGFTDMDREGMLIQGFDVRSMFITYYNAPYYNDHLQRLGYYKDTDWMEYKIYAPAKDSPQAVKIRRIAEHVMKNRHLHDVQVKHRWQYLPLIEEVFQLVNEAYAPLYGVVPLDERQVKKYASKFLPLINPDYACFIKDEQNRLVAFGVSAPSMARAMQKCRGKLFPLGWMYVLHDLFHNNALDMFLVAVRPELQGAGLNAAILNHLIDSAARKGIVYAETGPQLETNAKILAQWKMFDKDQEKRRRCYIKNLDGTPIEESVPAENA